METVYWTMKNGQKVDIDTMDINHLRNTLKMVVRNKIRVQANKPIEHRFKFNGEIAQEMHDNALIEEIMGDMLDEWYYQ
jgi:hypothetical protein